MNTLTFTVSQFVDFLREHLRTTVGEIVVQGEVSGFQVSGEERIFFELKDKTSRVKCFMLRWELNQDFEDGMEIRVVGVPQLFKTSGLFHVRVKEVQLVGEGALRKALLKLIEKLQKEGLMAQERKRVLPRFPERIGLITSQDAAAYTDVLDKLRKRWRTHTVVFAPVRVQGIGSAKDIVQAFQALNARGHIDVIILTRGGGSLEDLQSFNSEDVARAIVTSRAPVVAGVGHVRDETIAELVADLKALTPTAAAELVAPERVQVALDVRDLARRVDDAYYQIIQERSDKIRTALDRLQAALLAPRNEVYSLISRFRSSLMAFGERPEKGIIQINSLVVRISQAISILLRRQKDFIDRRFEQSIIHFTQIPRSAQEGVRSLRVRLLTSLPVWLKENERILQARHDLLKSFNPRAVLRRGYSMTFDGQGKIVHDASALRPGQRVQTKVDRGDFSSQVL